jgi:hypothetical protein
MMSVPVSTSGGFVAAKPMMLFEGEYIYNPFPLTGIAYDVSADGRRFLMTKEIRPLPSDQQLNIVLNWFEELTAKVPLK